MSDLLKMLSGGDLRSEGRAAEVAARVIDDPARLSVLRGGLSLEDKVIRGRTCMALEIVSRSHPKLLRPLVAERIPLAEAKKAHELLGKGGVIGKIVLICGEPPPARGEGSGPVHGLDGR